jgi:hypothetical protein
VSPAILADVLLEFVENLLIDKKETLKIGKEFSNSFLTAPKHVFMASLKIDGQTAREKLVKYIERVSNDLMAV